MKRLLVTGSREWTNARSVAAALDRCVETLGGDIGDITLVSGACPTGADALAEAYWASRGGTVERHPADWVQHGKKAGPLRNQAMADLGADLCVAFPWGVSRGTRHCMGAARAAGIPVVTPVGGV